MASHSLLIPSNRFTIFPGASRRVILLSQVYTYTWLHGCGGWLGHGALLKH